MLHKVRRTQSESNSHKKATNNLGSDRPGKRKIYNQHKQGQITNSSNPKNEKLICSQFNHERIRNQHQGALEKVEVKQGVTDQSIQHSSFKTDYTYSRLPITPTLAEPRANSNQNGFSPVIRYFWFSQPKIARSRIAIEGRSARDHVNDQYT